MAKLGSEKRSVRATVQTMDRVQKIAALCETRGWKVVVGIEPYLPEEEKEIPSTGPKPRSKSERRDQALLFDLSGVEGDAR